jgi:hypothetical protein
LPEQNSTAIQHEQVKLEKLKQKEISDLKSIIDFEIKLEDIRENNKRKLQLQKEKEEKIKEEKMKKIAEESLRRRMKEQEKQRKNQAEEEKTNRLLQEREEQERLNLLEEREKRELQEEENKRKMYDQKLKDEEFKRQIEDIFLSQQSKLLERQKSLNEKDEFRKRAMNQKKLEIMEKSKKKSEVNQMKIVKTIKNMEQRLDDQRSVNLV